MEKGKKIILTTITIIIIAIIIILTINSFTPNKKYNNYYIKYYVDKRDYAEENYDMYYVIPEPKEVFIINDEMKHTNTLDKMYVKRYYLDRDMAIVAKNILIYEIEYEGEIIQIIRASDIKHRKLNFKNSKKIEIVG